jgi:tricorn protease
MDSAMAGIFGLKSWLIINERASSGGDLATPYMFKQQELGPVSARNKNLGWTWTGLPPFIDGGRMVAPRGGPPL